MPSSVIASMQYDPALAILRIIFVSGMVYDYLDVPAKVYKAMKAASSRGAYLNRHIKGQYRFERVG